jgi:OFA family oxalate/formate antiporter-like MFS transporter
VLGALLIQLSLGAIYIYSVFKPALKERFPDWSDTDLALPSQLVLAFFAISMIFAGRIQDKLGPRLIATLGGIFLGAGLLIASFATNLTVFVIGFSIIGGIGVGTAYVCPIATCVKWFPDKRGLITGLAVAGFGAGALLFTPVAKSLIADQGIMTTFMYLGIIFLIAVVIGAQFMRVPPAGYKPAGWNPPVQSGTNQSNPQNDFSTSQMLKTSQFWLLWLTYFAGCTAGLMIIMNVTNVWQSTSFLKHIADGETLIKADIYKTITAAGATAVMIVAILNAFGRIAWGKVSDIIGRRKTLIIMLLLAGVVMLVLNLLKSYETYLIGVSIIGLCFGGFLALYPAVTADYFGTKNVGANYGWMFTAYGAGGLFGPWLAPKLMEVVEKIQYETLDKANEVIISSVPYNAGNYQMAFVISGIMCLIAAVLVYFIRQPKLKA